MKSITKYGIFALMGVILLASCVNKNARKNNYPTTEVAEPPVGQPYTIGELADMVKLSGDPNYLNDTIFNKDCSVYGIITGDETSDNLYKTAFIQERSTGKALELYMKGVTGLRIGDSVRVYLKGSKLGAYRGTLQIQDLEPINVIKIDNGKNIEPEVTTITDIKNLEKVCELIRLENVQFVDRDLSKTWAETNDYGERFIVQYDPATGHSLDSIMVRTSNYSTFGKKQVPQGNGYITALVTRYKTSSKDTWQLVVRFDNETEVLMNGPRYNN